MEKFVKLDVRIRNISLIILLIAILVLIIWIILFFTISEKQFQYLLYAGVALFLAGLLIFTRIQFVLWSEKRALKIYNSNYSII
jgi:hypothetical protein